MIRRKGLCIGATRVLSVLSVLAALAGCASSHGGIEGEVAAPGMPAHISSTDLSFAGGTGRLTITTIDSAAARYTVTTCETTVVSAQCPGASHMRQGVLQPNVRDQLFVATRSAEFQALRAEYRSTSSVRPPDLREVTLTITASERSRQIVWDSAVSIPMILSSYICQLQLARGDLITCFLPD